MIKVVSLKDGQMSSKPVSYQNSYQVILKFIPEMKFISPKLKSTSQQRYIQKGPIR